ncbi:MAG TPA: SDR family oxidoreductase [Gemmatimonadaceae bacterium]|nr:SDR family oxidoreductase [Gemmatimonadaceae bacterium]
MLTGVGREGQVGEAVAERLGHDGFGLILVDRDAANVEARAAELRNRGVTAHAHVADLADPQSVTDLFGRIKGQHGNDLAAFVHLAGGFAATGRVAETSVADWDRQLSINLRTAFLVSREAIPMLRRHRGSVVYFSSESALTGAKLSGIAAYGVAKSAVLSLAIAISQEEAEHGVRANILAPAAIRTASNTASMPSTAKFVEREDVAAMVAWLCSDEARAVTGQVIRLTAH